MSNQNKALKKKDLLDKKIDKVLERQSKIINKIEEMTEDLRQWNLEHNNYKNE